MAEDVLIPVDFDIGASGKPINITAPPRRKASWIKQPPKVRWERDDKGQDPIGARKLQYQITIKWKGGAHGDLLDESRKPILIARNDLDSRSATPKGYGKWTYSIVVDADPTNSNSVLKGTLDPELIFKDGRKKIIGILAALLTLLFAWWVMNSR